MLHAGLGGRFERAAMCRGGIRRADGADDQHPPSSGEARRQAGDPPEIAITDGGTEPRGIAQRLRRTGHQDQLSGGDTFEQRRHHEASQCARRAGDHQTQERPPQRFSNQDGRWSGYPWLDNRRDGAVPAEEPGQPNSRSTPGRSCVTGMPSQDGGGGGRLRRRRTDRKANAAARGKTGWAVQYAIAAVALMAWGSLSMRSIASARSALEILPALGSCSLRAVR